MSDQASAATADKGNEAATAQQTNQQQASAETADQASQAATAGSPPSVDDLQKQLEQANQRISQLNHESMERRKQLEAYEQQQTEAKRAKMSEVERLQAELDEAKTAAEAADAAKQQLEAYAEAVTAQVEAMQKELSIPKYVMAAIEDKPPLEQLQFINEHRKEFSKRQAPDLNGSATSSRQTPTPEQRRADLAQRFPNLGRGRA